MERMACGKYYGKMYKMDVSLTHEVGKATLPLGTDFNIEEGLDCYQNDEKRNNATNVGYVEEAKCKTTWNVSAYGTNKLELHNPPTMIKSDKRPCPNSSGIIYGKHMG